MAKERCCKMVQATQADGSGLQADCHRLGREQLTHRIHKLVGEAFLTVAV